MTPGLIAALEKYLAQTQKTADHPEVQPAVDFIRSHKRRDVRG
jgi:hypothetical protein